MKTIQPDNAARLAARITQVPALLLCSAALLSACGGGGGSAPGNDSAEASRQSLLYAYPDDGQTEVATPAPLVLRFTSDVTEDDAKQAITLHAGDADGPELEYTTAMVEDDQRGIVLTPVEKLDPLTDYTVVINDLKLDKGTAANRQVHFKTRALQRGPKSLMVSDPAFKLSRAIPSGDTNEPVMDFSTFRLQFTQPIDQATAHYGLDSGVTGQPDDTVALLDADGNLVDAALLIDGPYMTVDPKQEYLDAGQTYTLRIGDSLASTFADDESEGTFAGTEITFTPKDSSPRGEPAILVQRITDSNNRQTTSLLTGKPVNEVPVNATLLGNNSATQPRGDVRAELGDVTVYTDVTPIRIPRDTILTGSNIDVMIGGEVPAGIQSGAVKMHFLSDATGYLVPNPYNSQRDDALRIVHLFMDVAISTEEAEANGGFTQDLLHIELVGVGEVDPKEGVLNLDAVSMVEPDVLGQEFAYGLLSFQLQSYPDQENPPDNTVADTTPPTLQSWTLEDLTAQGGPDKSQMAKPGDPIILNFDEPLDRATIAGNVTLYKTDNSGVLEQDIDYYMDGAALVVKPKEPLQYSEELNPISYELQLGNGITDLAGNVFQEGFDEGFGLPLKVEKRKETFFGTTTELDAVKRSPYITGLYPGFPCALDPSTIDLEHGISGRCLGGISDQSDNVEKDDLLPIISVPANRPIAISFSKNIDGESVSLSGSFLVEKIDVHGNSLGSIAGKIEKKSRQLIFTPDMPWEVGSLYSYTLKSNGDISSSLAVCDGTQAICDEIGLPLQTQIMGIVQVTDLAQLNAVDQDHTIKTIASVSPTGGGPDLKQYFIGEEKSKEVLQSLKTSPITDVNSNLIYEKNREISQSSFELQASAGWIIRKSTTYSNEERSASNEPDENADQIYDPEGVNPRPNSAKIISTFYGIDTYENPYNTTTGLPLDGQSGNLRYYGGNTGCGYESFPEFEAAGCPDITGSSGPNCRSGVPATCPKEKFTYLNSALYGDVTSEYIEGKGLKVNLWPGQIVTTSFLTVLKPWANRFDMPVDSGLQIMRMRYSKDENGARTQPVPGWIKKDGNGNPTFTATVDLYLSAPQLQQNISDATGVIGTTHNFYSYQSQFNLSGPVTFQSDGRMKIEQYNIEPVNFELRGTSPFTILYLQIPAKGSLLSFVSSPIK
ncbi:Ig-like domain-containing protein [Alloalcanivorax mobilis]|uniref:Ig-like domain-containing protein n=1 Tax=Alloalcanivorax mobilis TaxID=2019569 RepID=UPI000C756A21|nr:Ig-like domain-containing protein [Alloalcanivorax mobilis]